MRTRAIGGWAGLLILAAAWTAAAAEVAYSFKGDGDGGAAVLRLDPQSGARLEHAVIFRSPDCAKAKKVRYSASGARVAVTVEREELPNFFVSAAAPGSTPVAVNLSGTPDEVRAIGEQFIVTCGSGEVVLVDGVSGAIVKSWNGRDGLTPPGNSPEDVHVLADGTHALVSFQSDSGKGKRFGNRLVLLALPDLRVVADLQLPRHAAELPANLQGQQPEPEIVLSAPRANAILATLDQYGAVALLDLDAARRGSLDRCVYLPTGPDGAWGVSFPDRATLFSVGTREYALVSNAGPDGDVVLVDPAARAVVRRWETPPGLEKPVEVPVAHLLAATCAGKLKQAGTRTFVPGEALYLFEFPGGNMAEANMREVPMGMKARHVAPVEPKTSSLVVVAAGQDDPDTLLVVDTVTGRERSREPALGRIVRLECSP